MNYILNGKKAVLEPSIVEWEKWYEKADREVETTMVGDIRISTIFLGYKAFRSATPILFATMVTGGDLDEEMSTYPTWEDSLYGHRRMVQSVKETESK